MQTTIDKAGRLVIPKELRDAIGLTTGPVDITVDGAGLRIEIPTNPHLVRKQGRLVIAPRPGSVPLTDEDVIRLRDAGRK